MSLPSVKIIDIQHNNEIVDIEELTETAIGFLIYEAKLLIDELEDIRSIRND